jgi:hypothetical protein
MISNQSANLNKIDMTGGVYLDAGLGAGDNELGNVVQDGVGGALHATMC